MKVLFCNGLDCFHIYVHFRVVCRYQYEKQVEELQKLKEYVEKRVLIEGTEMEKLYEAEVGKQVEVATVSNTLK
jgi:hypothetical protein